mmetsp:Transcript_6389/g.15697  ORF Transcript_6389/g.15697 Transcript_6389/m.15697 type:complete len:146 (+) Transcript_6389:161-598(+)
MRASYRARRFWLAACDSCLMPDFTTQRRAHIIPEHTTATTQHTTQPQHTAHPHSTPHAAQPTQHITPQKRRYSHHTTTRHTMPLADAGPQRGDVVEEVERRRREVVFRASQVNVHTLPHSVARRLELATDDETEESEESEESEGG